MRNPSNSSNPGTRASAGLPLVSRILTSLRLSHGAVPGDNLRATQCIRIREKVYEGKRLADLRTISNRHIIVREVRCRKTSTTRIASPEICLRQGDLLLAEGNRADLDAFCEEVGGQRASVDYLKFAETGSLAGHVRDVAQGEVQS